MSALRRMAALICCGSVSTALGAEVEYPPVTPGYTLSFPHDEGAHPEFRTEWWYVTGWLESESGEPLGFQITFFRSRPGTDENNPSRFAAKQLLFAHVALSDPGRGVLLRDERAARAGFGLAEARSGDLRVHIDDWMLERTATGYAARVDAEGLRMELQMQPTQPPLLQGERGFSQKGPAQQSSSYYYSLPQLATSGRIVVDERERRVSGVAWFDHEWSSSIMDAAGRGWDWVGLNLHEGGALMAFQMRNAEGGEHWASAARSERGAAAPQIYSREQIEWTALRRWRSPRTGAEYPIEWKLTVGERTLFLKPLMDDQENDARGSTGTLYWEGAVRAFDERGQEVGRGYLELTGYGSELRF